jgi:hypothetical protein
VNGHTNTNGYGGAGPTDSANALTAPASAEDQEALFSFVDVVFNNILDLRETNRRSLEKLYVRQREQVGLVFVLLIFFPQLVILAFEPCTCSFGL